MNAQELRTLRQQAGLSQQALADAMGLVWQNTVSRWELGHRTISEPHAKLIRIICAQTQKKPSPP